MFSLYVPSSIILHASIWVNQLSKSAPNTIILTAIVDALFFYGTAYLEVTEVYQDDNRPARFDFVNNTRVQVQLNKLNIEIILLCC